MEPLSPTGSPQFDQQEPANRPQRKPAGSGGVFLTVGDAARASSAKLGPKTLRRQEDAVSWNLGGRRRTPWRRTVR